MEPEEKLNKLREWIDMFIESRVHHFTKEIHTEMLLRIYKETGILLWTNDSPSWYVLPSFQEFLKPKE
jgi:hypothetical protein